MRIAVTGASGFMGGVLARALAANGHTVYSYGGRDAAALRCAVPNYRQWDLTAGPIDVPEVDAAIHCAAMVGDWGSEVHYRRVNVGGTRAVLDAFRTVEQFVHVSSASVYSSDRSGRSLSEDDPIGGALYTAYARTKAEAERVVLSSGRDAVILRPHIVYGPGDTTLMPRVLAARRLGCLPVPGSGRNRLSVTHVLNFVHAVERVLATATRTGIFNIADLEPAPVDELLTTMLRLSGAPTRLLHIPQPIAWAIAWAGEHSYRLAGSRRAPRLTRYLVSQVACAHTLDLSRACQLLGYAPRHDFRDDAAREERT